MNAGPTFQCLLVACILFLDTVESNSPESDQGCVGASSGVPGIPGTPGHNGLPGRDGLQGEKGSDGMKGSKGDKGDKGAIGKTGPKGANGQMGEKGIKGENGNNHSINWKQCAWKREEHKDTGLIQECVFKKRHSSTALKVAYAANMRVACSSGRCCGRWYITFNGVECSGPTEIDGVLLLQKTGDNPARHRQIEGFCENIPSGLIRIAVHVGNCEGYGTSDRHSGYISVSRIMIEEYSQSQN